MFCYICGVNIIGEAVLVREHEALDDLVMSHDDYHHIRICDICNQKIEWRIRKEKNESRRRHRRWIKENPEEAYRLAQARIDAMSGNKDGLVVRDILPTLD